jgi:hypothetical protein
MMSKEINCSISAFKRKNIGQEKEVSDIPDDSRQKVPLQRSVNRFLAVGMPYFNLDPFEYLEKT